MCTFSKTTTQIIFTVVLSFMAQVALADELAGSEWTPTGIECTSFDKNDDIFVRFEQDGRYIGNGGCNGLLGRYVINGNAILFGPTAATMMACDDATSREEAAVLSALAPAREFARDGVELDLLDAASEIVMRLSLRDAD